jgi:hypothetical protein
MATEQVKDTAGGKVPALNIERVYSTTVPADELAQAKSVREIDGTAHAVPFDAPGNFAQVITETMRSSEVRSAAERQRRTPGRRLTGRRRSRAGTTVSKPGPRTEDSVRAGGDDDVCDPRATVPPG